MKWEDELPAGQARGSVKGGDRKFNCSDGYKKVSQFEVLYSVTSVQLRDYSNFVSYCYS